MILLIDQENEIVTVYADTGKTEIPFTEIEDLLEISDNKPFLYVTDAIETTSKEVINLVKQITPDHETIAVGADEIDENEVYFLRSPNSGLLLLSDMGLEFSGPSDMKEIDNRLLSLIKNSVAIQSMIQRKQLEIVDRRRMNVIMRQYRREQDKKEKEIEGRQKTAGRANDERDVSVSIIDGSAADFAANMGSGMASGEAMDITDEVNEGSSE